MIPFDFIMFRRPTDARTIPTSKMKFVSSYTYIFLKLQRMQVIKKYGMYFIRT